MPRLPMFLRMIVACSLALMVGRSSLQACSGDQYWGADPEGTLTWYKRGLDIPVRLPLSRAFEVMQQALQEAALAPCDAPEKDLVSQKVKVLRAFRTDVVQKRIPAGLITHLDYSQFMVRIVSRGGSEYVAEILTRTKRATGTARPSEVADEFTNCGASAIADKVRGKLASLAAAK
jgi:hypothetical protein